MSVFVEYNEEDECSEYRPKKRKKRKAKYHEYAPCLFFGKNNGSLKSGRYCTICGLIDWSWPLDVTENVTKNGTYYSLKDPEEILKEHSDEPIFSIWTMQKYVDVKNDLITEEEYRKRKTSL